MIKVVLDSNVLISSIVFGGNPRKIFKKIIEGKIKLSISLSIIEEIREVLGGDKFKYSPAVLNIIINELLAITEVVEPMEILNVIDDDPDDNRILECAVEAGADYIITGDKHLLKKNPYFNIRIMNPYDFLEKVLVIEEYKIKDSG